MNLILYLVIWTTALYLFNCLIAKRFIKLNPKILILYVTSVIFAGMYAEVIIDTVYNYFFNQPLWEYRIYPIHFAYTSYFSLAVWGVYGFHIYLLHDTLQRNKSINDKQLIGVLTVESIIFEILANLTFLIIFGNYIFYYLPNDLWHLTSIQALPFYVLGAFIIIQLLRKYNLYPIRFIFINLILTTLLLIFA